jgi:hypothetical protein
MLLNHDHLSAEMQQLIISAQGLDLNRNSSVLPPGKCGSGQTTGSSLARAFAARRLSESAEWKSWCRFWPKFSGSETERIICSSIGHGSPHANHATRAFHSSQSFNARSPAPNVILRPLSHTPEFEA